MRPIVSPANALATVVVRWPGAVLVFNALAVVAMLVALTKHDGLVLDATLRHYMARETASGARDEALSRLHSSYSTVRHPPSFTTADRAFHDALEQSRLGSTLGAIPIATLRGFLTPPRSTLERTFRGDVAAGILGDSGADELHVLAKVARSGENSFANQGNYSYGFGTDFETSNANEGNYSYGSGTDVFDDHALVSMCELKHLIERAPGYTDVCRLRDGYDEESSHEGNYSYDGTETFAETELALVQKTCHPTWSVFDVAGAYESIGLGEVLLAVSRFGKVLHEKENSGGFERGRGICGLQAASTQPGNKTALSNESETNTHAGHVLCRDKTFATLCDPGGCSLAIRDSLQTCVLGGFVEACALLQVVEKPDISVLSDFHEMETNKAPGSRSECDAAEALKTRVTKNLNLGAVVKRWSDVEHETAREQRTENVSLENEEQENVFLEKESIHHVLSILSPNPFQTLAAPWSLLVDARFFEPFQKTVSKTVSRSARLVFFTRRFDGGGANIGKSRVTPAVRWITERVGPGVIEPFLKTVETVVEFPTPGIRSFAFEGDYTKNEDSRRTRTTQTVTASWEHAKSTESSQTAALWRDVRWALGSLLVTACVMCVHAGDFRLAVGAIVVVSASLVPAMFLYVFVFRITWVGALNFLGCFVIFAIGADDAFVLLEFWRKAPEYMVLGGDASTDHQRVPTSPDYHHSHVPGSILVGEESGIRSDTVGHAAISRSRSRNTSDARDANVQRMRWTLEKSGYAVTTTSVTTALAFLGNVGSPIIPIRLFGVYMAGLVVSNYLLICSSFPALLVLAELRKKRVEERINDNVRRERHGVEGSESTTDGAAVFRDTRFARETRNTHTAAPESPRPRREPAVVVSDNSDCVSADTPSAPPLLTPPSPITGTAPSILARRHTRANGNVPPTGIRHRRTKSTVTFGLGTEGEPFSKTVVVGHPVATRRSLSLNLDQYASPDTFGASCGNTEHRRNESFRAQSFGYPQGDLVLTVQSDDDFDDFGTPRSEFRALSFEGGDTHHPDVRFEGQSSHQSRVNHESIDAILDPDDGTAMFWRAYGFGKDLESWVKRCTIGVDGCLTRFVEFTTSRFGARCVVLIAFVFVILSISVARNAAPPKFATTTKASFVESRNSKTFRLEQGKFPFARVTGANRVTFVFGVADSGARFDSARKDDDSSGFQAREESRNGLLSSIKKTVEPVIQPFAEIFENGLSQPDLAVGGGANTAAAPEFDTLADLASPETQVWMLHFCVKLRLMLGHRVQSITCFHELIDARVRAMSGGAKKLPLARGEFLSAAKESNQNFDVGARWWRDDPSWDGESPIASVEVSVTTNTTVSSFTKKTDLNAERVFWRDFFSNAMETAPRRIQNSAFVTSRTWALIDTESALTNSAWYGLVTSLVCSCVVVLIASGGSWRLAALASGSVGTVAVSFVAFLVSAGWTVGIEESVCITVLVGLSLDYVLHVAGAFVKAPALGLGRLDNTQRARWALRSTGKSVFMGASTTVAAASFLVFKCDADFFQTFGAFVLWTTTVSSVVATTVFPASVALWGAHG